MLASMVKKNASIELLQRQIDAATGLEPADLDRWKIRTENAIRFTVGEASPALKGYRGVSFGPSGYNFGRPMAEREAASKTAWRRGVDEAVECLQFAIYEVEVWLELQDLKGQSTDSATPT